MELNAVLRLTLQNRGTGTSYSPRRLRSCVEKVRRKELRVRAASSLFEIPRFTLQRHLKSDIATLVKRRPGPLPVLGEFFDEF